MNNRTKMKKSIFNFVLFLFLSELGVMLFGCSHLHAQQIPYKIIGLKDGLPQSSILKMIQDKQGYMWIATQGGLCRYDGLNFKVFSMYDGVGSQFILSMDLDDQGQLWMATFYNGVCCYDGKKFISFNRNTGLFSNDIRRFKKTRSGDYFLSTVDSGIIWVDPYLHQKVIRTPEGEIVPYARGILELPNGNIWVGWNDGIIELQKDKNYLAQHRLKKELEIVCFEQASNGDIWAGGAQSLWQFTKDSVIDRSALLPANSEVCDMYEDESTGTLHFGTTAGLLQITNGKSKLLGVENGLPVNDIRSITKDANGDLWLGTFAGGTVIMQNKGIDHFGGNGETGGFGVNTLVEDTAGNVWIASNGTGLYVSNGSTIEKPTFVTDQEVPNAICSVSDPKTGSVYFAQYEGRIIKIQNNKITWRWIPSINEPTRILGMTIYEDKLFLSTQSGIYTLSEKENKLIPIEGIENFYCNYAFPDGKDNLWLLGADGEIIRWHHGKYTDLTSILNPARSSVVHGIYAQRSQLYLFCSTSGLIIWDGQNSFKLHSKNGAHSDYPWSVAEDKNGNIWLGHANGVECIDLKNNRSEFLSYDQGFTPIETNSCASLCDKFGNIWFGTVHTATRIRVNDIQPKKTINHLWMQKIKVNDDLIFEQDLMKTDPGTIVLPHNKNNLAIDLVAISYDNCKDVKFSWILEGSDSKYTEFNSERKVIYSNLTPGTYTFQATAMDPDGFTASTTKLKIIIQKPVWNRWWFYGIEILIMAFLIFLSFRFNSNPTQNKTGNLLTLVCILIIFETILIYVSDYVNAFTGGVPIFQLIMNVILAGTLHPLEQSIRKFMRKWAIKKRRKSTQNEVVEQD